MIDPSAVSRLGLRGPTVTRLGLGCAAIGNLYTAITDDEASATVDAAWQRGIRLFDTAPLYGAGLSERRLGCALRNRPRNEYVLCTKVGKLLRSPDGEPAATIFADTSPLDAVPAYSGDDVRRSLEESLLRLGVDQVDVVHLHDPDNYEQQALTEAFPALLRLRDEGVIGAVGCGMNQTAMLTRFVERIDLDCVLLAGRYSLLDRIGAEELLPMCAERSVGVIVGGVFNSGVLVQHQASPTYDYAPAADRVVDRVRSIHHACAEAGVSPVAAAVQFALRHPAVTSVVVGARSADEVGADVDAACAPIPDRLWPELERISADA